MCFSPKIPPQPRPVQAQDVNTAGLRQRQALAGQKGQASTVLTSPLGATDYSSNQTPKTLLGG